MTVIEKKETLAAIFAFIAFTGLICSVILPEDAPNGKTTYVIQVDDTINFNEFYRQYDILSKEPYTNIYRVEERENND